VRCRIATTTTTWNGASNGITNLTPVALSVLRSKGRAVCRLYDEQPCDVKPRIGYNDNNKSTFDPYKRSSASIELRQRGLVDARATTSSNKGSKWKRMDYRIDRLDRFTAQEQRKRERSVRSIQSNNQQDNCGRSVRSIHREQ
jgi:hypothetical protein